MTRSTLVAMLILGAILPAPVAAADGIEGVWRNHKDSVRIRTYACGDAICADIVQASAEAQADAVRKGRTPLIGRQIFSGFHPVAGGQWKGRVYVPDLDRTFSGTLRVTPDDRLAGRGCALAGLICKEKVWYRVR